MSHFLILKVSVTNFRNLKLQLLENFEYNRIKIFECKLCIVHMYLNVFNLFRYNVNHAIYILSPYSLMPII